METKINLYPCESCEKVTSKVFGYKDETGALCEDCWNEYLAKADLAYDAWKERDLV